MKAFAWLWVVVVAHLLCQPAVVVSTTIAPLVSHPSRRQQFVSRLRGGSLQSRRWERMDGKALSGGQQQHRSLQSSLQSAAAGRACGFYVWDAPSALLHKWCQHLLKDCVYEGLGGRKFVRIEPGSILQLLYPCSRYSPDRCLVCGGSFRDHLTLWWGKHLYTPFDQFLDRTYSSGVVLEPKFPPMPKSKSTPKSRNTYSSTPRRRRSSSRRTSTTRQTKKKSSHNIEMIQTFAFHRNYVTDLESLAPGITDPKEKTRKIRRELKKLQGNTGTLMEYRIHTDRKMAYVVPAPPKDQPQSFTLRFIRLAALNAVDLLIGLQETENEKIRLQARTGGGCC